MLQIALLLMLNGCTAMQPTIDSLWDQHMSTAAPPNSTLKIQNWDKLTGGRVIMLLPFTTNAEVNADDGILDQLKHPFRASADSLAQLALDDHLPLSILPHNIDNFYNQTNQFAALHDTTVTYKSIPRGMVYADYVQQILQACNGKQSGAFDVVWLDATAAGILGDCLSNLYEWNSDIAVNQEPHILANNIVKTRLVGLPIESSTGMLYYNKNIFVRNMMEAGFTTMSEFESLVQQIVVSERTIHSNFDVIGLSMSMRANEAFMGSFIELLANTNYSSVFNTFGNDSSIATPETINLIQRLVSWLDAGIIEPTQLDETGTELPFAQKFIQGRSVFLRSYSTVDMSQVQFDLGYAPMRLQVTPLGQAAPMGVNNGWSLGVYKYSSNLDASVNIIKRIASSDFQRQSILASTNPIQPTYPGLLNDPLICALYGDKCSILKSTTIINRPAVLARTSYPRLSSLLTTNITTLITNPLNIIQTLTQLDTQFDTLLNLKVTAFNGTLDLGANIATIIKKIPSAMGTQFTILMLFMFGCILAIFVYKRRTLVGKVEALSNAEKGFMEVGVVDKVNKIDEHGLEKIEI